jgi:transcriptional regulator with XRE-family HTH domain
MLVYVYIEAEAGMTFTEKMEKLLRDNRGSQHKIAEKLGINSSTFTSSIRRGSDKMKMSHIVAIADYFEVSVDYLLRDDIDDPHFHQEIPATPEEAMQLLERLFQNSKTSKADRERVVQMAMELWLSDSKDR